MPPLLITVPLVTPERKTCSCPPFWTVALTSVPPALDTAPLLNPTSSRPPLLTMALLPTPPLRIISWPPALTTVPRAIPPLNTTCWASTPAERASVNVVLDASALDRTWMVPPPNTVSLSAVCPPDTTNVCPLLTTAIARSPFAGHLARIAGLARSGRRLPRLRSRPLQHVDMWENWCGAEREPSRFTATKASRHLYAPRASFREQPWRCQYGTMPSLVVNVTPAAAARL